MLTHPTTGGVSASLGMLGDVNVAEPLAFNLDSVTAFDDPRQLNSFLDMRPIHDPDDLSGRFRERIRESFDPFAHLLHLRGIYSRRQRASND